MLNYALWLGFRGTWPKKDRVKNFNKIYKNYCTYNFRFFHRSGSLSGFCPDPNSDSRKKSDQDTDKKRARIRNTCLKASSACSNRPAPCRQSAYWSQTAASPYFSLWMSFSRKGSAASNRLFLVKASLMSRRKSPNSSGSASTNRSPRSLQIMMLLYKKTEMWFRIRILGELLDRDPPRGCGSRRQNRRKFAQNSLENFYFKIFFHKINTLVSHKKHTQYLIFVPVNFQADADPGSGSRSPLHLQRMRIRNNDFNKSRNSIEILCIFSNTFNRAVTVPGEMIRF